MKTITLHIGNPKTGTTSIQKTLAANSKRLEKKGIIYPLGPMSVSRRKFPSRQRTHRWLLLLVEPDRSKWPRTMRARISEADAAYAVRNAQKSFARLLKKVERSSAQRVILSTENLGSWDVQKLSQLMKLLAPLDAKYEILCYYRNPAKSYLAKLQQQVKASGSSHSFSKSVRSISRTHANYSAVFGDSVSIRLFDRGLLKDGDVVSDFLSAVGLDNQTIGSLPKVDANVSGPGELTAAQYWIRSRAFEDLEGNFSGANKNLNRALLKAMNGLELGRAKLAPGVAETVYFHNREELRWLKSELGLVFDEIDYDDLDNPPTVDLNSAELSDLIQSDPEKTDLLIARTIRELCNSAGLRNSFKAYF